MLLIKRVEIKYIETKLFSKSEIPLFTNEM